MTKQERIRAIFGNLKNYTWEVNPTYSINEQDAFVLREMYAEYLAYKMHNEKLKRYNREHYKKNAEKYRQAAKERYHRNVEENRAKARERYTKKKGETAE